MLCCIIDVSSFPLCQLLMYENIKTGSELLLSKFGRMTVLIGEYAIKCLNRKCAAYAYIMT